ncbi:hypothetical protein ACHAQA_007475 [Verticillium albo-atrum]
MDPATALGVASSAITLVEFATKIIIKTNEIRKNGQSHEVKELKAQTQTLASMHERLHNRNRSMADASSSVSQIEKAAELLPILEKLTAISPSFTPSFHKSFQKAMSTLWKSDEMLQLAQRLHQHRSHLNSQVIVLMNEKMEHLYNLTGDGLNRVQNLQAELSNGHKQILEAIAFNQDKGIRNSTTLYVDMGKIDSELSLAQLKRAFIRLISAPESDHKFCFMIDGLDEYTGEHSELCDLLTESVQSPNIKFLIASRPWGVFTDAFDRYPTIRMQDLTAGDIENYVDDAFSKYLSRRAGREQELRELSQSVTLRAAGVFLWVVLVVRELRRGFQSHDDISDLQRRLDAFPTDLSDFYRYMYDRIDVIHRPKCCKILLTLLRTKELPIQGLLSLMQMSFAESETLATAIKAPLRSLEVDRWLETSNVLKHQIENKTLGLVDVRAGPTTASDTSDPLDLCVDFIHRTVYDFFLLSGLEEEMKAEVPKDFDPTATILACYLVEIKAFPIQPTTILEHNRVIDDVMNCLRLVRHLELERHVPFPDVMESINKSMIHYWTRIKERRTTHEDERLVGTKTWSQYFVTDIFRTPWTRISPSVVSKVNYFLFLGILSGCVLSVADRTRPGSNLTNKERTQILSMLLFRYFNDPLRQDGSYKSLADPGKGKANFVAAIGTLLEDGAEPETLSILSGIDLNTKRFNGMGSVFDTGGSMFSMAGYTSNHTSNGAQRLVSLTSSNPGWNIEIDCKSTGGQYLGTATKNRDNRGLYSSPWRYFLDQLADVAQRASSQGFSSEGRELAILTAIDHLRICQRFLSTKINVTEELETILEQLHDSVSEASAEHRQLQFQQGDMNEFRSEYKTTMRIIRNRKIVRVARPQLRVWWDLRRVMPQEAIGGGFSNVIILILLIIIAYLVSSRDGARQFSND